MKILPLPLVMLMVSQVMLSAQAPPAPQPTPPAKPAPSLVYLGNTYTLGSLSQSNTYAQNAYYMAKESPKGWSQRLHVAIHPQQNDIKQTLAFMTGVYKKAGQETELGNLSTDRVLSLYAYEKRGKYHQYNIHYLTQGSKGKGVIVRTFSARSLPKNEKTFRQKTAKIREGYLVKLAAAKFPKFVLKQSAASSPASADSKLPELDNITEKVTDIQGKGQLVNIDENFAKKNGAKPGGHRPFSIVVPDSDIGKAMINARPKVKDMVRLTLVGERGNMLESLRFTSISIGTNTPMPERLQRAAALVEKQMVPKFFAGQKDAKIGMRYRTKVGPYDAACLLGRFTAQDGTILYIKFVSILEENKPAGIMAIMFLNPTGDKPLNIKKRLQDGFAQRILHSVRLK